MRLISGSMLYDAIQCPHRSSIDTFEDPTFRDEPNAFLELLWEEGWAHEDAVIERYSDGVLNLAKLEPSEREIKTLEAIQAQVPLIYGGRVRHGDLVGEPDLLRSRGGGYIAGDIKSGSEYDGDDSDGKQKTPYAVQVAHYIFWFIADLEARVTIAWREGAVTCGALTRDFKVRPRWYNRVLRRISNSERARTCRANLLETVRRNDATDASR